MFASAFILVILALDFASCERGKVAFIDTNGERFRGMITIPIKNTVRDGWSVVLEFAKPVVITNVWNATITRNEQSNYTTYKFKNKNFNFFLPAGADLVITFLAKRFSHSEDPSSTVVLYPRKLKNCPDINPPQGFLTTTVNITIVESWPGEFKAKVSVINPANLYEWKIHLKFSEKIKSLEVAKANHNRVETNYYVLSPKVKHLLKVGEKFEINFIARGPSSSCITGIFAWTDDMVITTPVVTDQSTSSQPSTSPTAINPVTSEELTTKSTSSTTTSGENPTAVANTFLQKCKNAVNQNSITGARIAKVIPNEEWATGLRATISITISEAITDGWKMIVYFSTKVKNFQVWRAIPDKRTGTRFVLKNMPWNKNLVKGSILEFAFLARKITPKPAPKMCAIFVGSLVTIPTTPLPTATTDVPTAATTSSTVKPSTITPRPSISTTPHTKPTTPGSTTEIQSTGPTTTPIATTKPAPEGKEYNYQEVLHKSILFYEAQRSGYLPANNRIPWRGDSTTNDVGENGEDLVGGWFDAGDHVKFGFPMAFSTTLLTWGLLEYEDAYRDSGELENMLSCIKWPLDYFVKAHVKPNVLYGQVGDGHVDHSYWGRPELMTMNRPAFKIDKAAPGSDLAAETAAALAAGSIAFRSSLPSYAKNLLKHAKELFSFADTYRRKYSESIPNARTFYNSASYKDELVWGAIWLYKATNEKSYLTKAENYFSSFGLSTPGWAFSWDEKIGGLQILLYQLTKKEAYKNAIIATLDQWLPGGQITYTPKGLAWRLQWGPNRYAANTAYLALVAADQGIKTDTYRNFGKKQIHYMLGDSGRSYVVGFGKNPPVNPHHRGSSCKVTSTSCSINDPTPNPNVLYGALVGGPDKNDNYKDSRHDYIMNEVATDYNAGFQSAVAALKNFEMKK